jgi:hypothetical protein
MPYAPAPTFTNPPPFRPSTRLDGIEVSLIVRISEQAQQARLRGESVIGLGTGEPDVDTPPHVLEAAQRAMTAGETKYPITQGSVALRSAIRDKFDRDNSLSFDLNQIIVSTGAKQVLFNAFFATLNPGDEVIIPAPYWTSYLDIVRACGGVPVVVQTQACDGFRLSPDALRAAITPRTRWLLLNAPSNPTGATYSEAQLRDTLAVLADHPQVWVLSDDIYEHIRFQDTAFVTTATAIPELRNRTLTVNGVSKAYAMTGRRRRLRRSMAPPTASAMRSRSIASGVIWFALRLTPCPASTARRPRAPFTSSPRSRDCSGAPRRRARPWHRRWTLPVTLSKAFKWRWFPAKPLATPTISAFPPPQRPTTSAKPATVLARPFRPSRNARSGAPPP